MEQGINKSIVFGNCPHCNGPLAIGLAQLVPQFQYILKPVDLEEKRSQLVLAINESSLNDEQKKFALDTYGDPGTMMDPEAADFMIAELRSQAGGGCGDPEINP